MRMNSQLLAAVAVAIAVVVVAAAIYFAARSFRRGKRSAVADLFDRYFRKDIAAEELGRRVKEIAGRYILPEAELYALSVGAFQRAVDRARGGASFGADEKQLLSLLAALKNELGLPDLYRIEGWRAGRE